MENICNQELYDEVARELNISSDEVEKIVKAQSQYTRHIIEVGKFEGIRYVYLGKIAAKTRKVQQLNQAQGER